MICNPALGGRLNCATQVVPIVMNISWISIFVHNSCHFTSRRAEIRKSQSQPAPGIRVRLLSFDLLPEIRFLHRTSRYYNPVQNQAILTLAIVFPAPR